LLLQFLCIPEEKEVGKRNDYVGYGSPESDEDSSAIDISVHGQRQLFRRSDHIPGIGSHYEEL
jgi:hypothetical protein